MATKPPSNMKPTLDKDLDKFTRVEEATLHVTQQLAGLGAGFMFVVLAAVFAGAFVTGTAGAVIIIAAVAIGAYMAINIGANDVTNNVGPAVGAKAMPLAVALIVAAICEIAGALITGGNVVETISSGIINVETIPDRTAFSWAMLSALLAAGLLVNISTWTRAPISTTHTVVGGVAGAGMAAYGAKAVDWLSLGSIAFAWVLAPFISAFIAVAILAFIKEFIIYREDKIGSARLWVPVLIGLMAGVFMAYLIWVGLRQLMHVSLGHASLIGLVTGLVAWRLCVPIIHKQSEGLENRNQSLRILFQWPLVLAAALMSFAHGANDVSNAIGPVVAIVRALHDEAVSTSARAPLWVMLVGAFGLSCGILLYGPRLIRLVGEQITKLNPMRAFCVSVATALTVLVASRFGLPVSTTHTAIGAVFGVGFFREWYTQSSWRRQELVQAGAGQTIRRAQKYADNPSEVRRRYLVRRSHFMTIIAAWLVTVPLSATLAALLYWLMSFLFL
ncbi:inorganic phosphate transporter [Agrobacterium tumefaciens]|uniref:inorganic phosphate transporter n=1 Tax=Agrobacterium tumefaciens TaxID=358 RepID=UPI001FAA53F8|nr:inorganic phosphate transporter [Agrobacterium tumefaciens]UNZ50779.1 inorganic phosphate transporter [Agrobacterium tumefaciens]